MKYLPLILAAIATMAVGCASSEAVRRQRTPDEIFADGMKAFEDENWLDAQTQFDIIKLQYPASQVADDAQFYLAEINFKRGEYILASFNYALMRRTYPNSPFAKEALYRSALSYYELAPPADRDQEYTRKAIQAFSEFETAYPRDSLGLVAAKRIGELRGRLAEKHMEAAAHYVRTSSNRAAVIYFNAVIDEYPDTPWYEPALVGKITSLLSLKRMDEARTAIDLYRRTVKDGSLRADVERLESEIR